MIEPHALQTLERLEDAAARGATRNASALARHTSGNLAGLLASLLATPNPCIALVSGFWILHSKPPAAETDGPVGAALLAKLFGKLGWRTLGLADTPCEAPLRAAYEFGGIASDDVLATSIAGLGRAATPIDFVRDWLKDRGATHLLSIERPGVSADGKYYNMRGADLTRHVYPFDPLFRQPACVTAAIGDGGNEIGMGSIPTEVIAREIENGPTIASITPAQFTLVCGVSNWGAHLIAAGLSLLSPTVKEAFVEIFTESVEMAALKKISQAGAVDGVSGRRALSVDGISMDAHFEKYRELRRELAASEERP